MDGADSARATVINADAPIVDAAAMGFQRAYPARSAKRTAFITQLLAFALLTAALVVALLWAPAATWAAIRAFAFTLFAAAIVLRLFAAAHLKPLLSRLADTSHAPVCSILCPLYNEANVVPDLIHALQSIDYPRDKLDILLIVEGDDAATLSAVLAADAPSVRVIIVPPTLPRTKPKALNVGLAYARGSYVVVYDAEDRPHPQQIRAALAAFEDGPETLACVQAPLDIYNANASWIARQFAAEYAILFREILPMFARLHIPFPLGGTSNHFRADALRAVGGWDPHNVREKVRAFAA